MREGWHKLYLRGGEGGCESSNEESSRHKEPFKTHLMMSSLPTPVHTSPFPRSLSTPLHIPSHLTMSKSWQKVHFQGTLSSLPPFPLVVWLACSAFCTSGLLR